MEFQYIEDILGIGAFAPAARYALLTTKSKPKSSELLELLQQKTQLKDIMEQNSELVSETPKLLERLVELDQEINGAILQKAREQNFLPFLLVSAILTVLISPVLVKTNQYALNDGVFRGDFLAKSILFLVLALLSMLVVRMFKGGIEKRVNSSLVFTAACSALFMVMYVGFVFLVVGMDPFTRAF